MATIPTYIRVSILIATFAGAGYLRQANAASAEKPNIVFIITDDHRWDGLHLAGNKNLKTPNLDRLAKEGQWYSQATIQTSTCSASRAAILTGLPSYRNGWYSNQKQREDLLNSHGFDQYQLLPKVIHKAGYQTAFVGKWHLVPDPWQCGFDTVKHWMEAGAGPYRNPRLSFGNKRDSKVVNGYTQTLFADDAISVLKDAAKPDTTAPLFLWLAFTAPHARFGPNPPPISGMYDSKNPAEMAGPHYFGEPGKIRAPKVWSKYSEAITAADAEIGRVMETIRNSSLSTNTLVVVMGDNGYMMGSHDMYGKYVAYEDSLRVPMIMWGPDSIMGAKGTTVTAAVNSIDLSPTFVKLAGGNPPKEWTGRDLSSVIKDGQPHDITRSFSSYPDNSHILKHVDAYRVLRTPEYKLISWHPDTGKTFDLYDLKKDPGETNNLYGKPEVADVQTKLEKELADYRKATGDDQWELKGPVGSFKAMRDDGNEPGEQVTKKRKGKKAESAKGAGRKKPAPKPANK